MKLSHVDETEIDVMIGARVECFHCESSIILTIDPSVKNIKKHAAEMLAEKGWHQVEAIREITSCACSDCISEIRALEEGAA